MVFLYLLLLVFSTQTQLLTAKLFYPISCVSGSQSRTPMFVLAFLSSFLLLLTTDKTEVIKYFYVFSVLFYFTVSEVH